MTGAELVCLASSAQRVDELLSPQVTTGNEVFEAISSFRYFASQYLME